MWHYVLALAMAALPGVALAQSGAQGAAQGGDATAGRVVAQTWCAGCHAVEARPAASSDPAPGFAIAANRPGVTADGLSTYLAEPHGRMPNLSLSRTDIANVVAYLLSMRSK